MRELETLIPYLRSRWRTIATGMLLVVVSNAFNVLTPRFVQHGIDALAGTAPGEALRTAAALVIATAMLGGVARYGMRQLLNAASRDVEYAVRNTLYRHLQLMSPAFYDKYATGDVMARTTNDLGNVRMVAGPALMYLADTMIRAALVIPIMLGISVRLTLLALLPLASLPVVMSLIGRIIHRRSEAIQAQFSALSTHAHENLSGVRVVRAYRQEASEEARFRGLNEEYARRNLSLARVQGLFHPLLGMIGGAGAIAVTFVGGRQVMAGTVSIGQFIAFGIYLAALVWPMIALGWVISLVQRGAASMGRINELLRSAPAVAEPAAPVALPPSGGARSLAFEHVWFRYPLAHDRGWVLQDVSFELPAGEALAVVGATGAGKTSLADLIVRAYDPDRGRVLIDGVDIRTLALAELRRAVGFVPQETFLFSATLRENVLLDAPDDGRLERAAETAQLTEALPMLPLGYDTMLGERGINLSGGQKQRAAIARALAQDPPIFVLDDALSAVDAGTEARILAALRGALEGRTSVVISHRMAAVRAADLILVLEGGRIVEQGSHAELLRTGTRYGELLSRQRLEDELEVETGTTAELAETPG